MTMEVMIQWGNDKPQNVFLIDGLGAILSASLLGIVLVQWERFFGMPRETLCFLASLPCLFAIYDFYCYLNIDKNAGMFLKGIAIANLLYSLLSIGSAIYNLNTITYLGWIYIVVEIIIVTTIAILEWNVASRLLTNTQSNR